MLSRKLAKVFRPAEGAIYGTIFLAGAFVFPYVSAQAQPPQSPSGTVWQLNATLSDEFDGTKLDEAKWLNYNPRWSGRLPSVFDPKNVSVSRGYLRLKTMPKLAGARSNGDTGGGPWIASASVRSVGQTASYGYYEARIRASSLSATSSFWFKGTFSELDVVEAIGNSKKRPSMSHIMHSTTHYLTDHGRIDSTSVSNALASTPVTNWHTYGVWWKDSRTAWLYLDNVEVGEVSTKGDFIEPMFLYFDTEAVEATDGLPDMKSLRDPRKNTMLVDWVRAYKLVPAH